MMRFLIMWGWGLEQEFVAPWIK